MSEIEIDDLVNLAVQYRAMAASVFNQDKDEYHRLEAQADELYSLADSYGLEFYEVPRLDEVGGRKDRTKNCLECGSKFEAQRSTAKYCSDACRQAYYRREAA